MWENDLIDSVDQLSLLHTTPSCNLVLYAHTMMLIFDMSLKQLDTLTRIRQTLQVPVR